MDSGHYVHDVLDYNAGTWWGCDDDMINNYLGYPDNFYYDLSHYNKQKGVGGDTMNLSDRIVSMLYKKRDILTSRTYSFFTSKSVSKDTENIN